MYVCDYVLLMHDLPISLDWYLMGILPIARMPTLNSVCVTETKKRKEPEAIVDGAEEDFSSAKKVKLEWNQQEKSMALAHANNTTSKAHNTAILISSDVELPESDSDSDVQVIQQVSSTVTTKSRHAVDSVSNTSSSSSSSCIAIIDPKEQKKPNHHLNNLPTALAVWTRRVQTYDIIHLVPFWDGWRR